MSNSIYNFLKNNGLGFLIVLSDKAIIYIILLIIFVAFVIIKYGDEIEEISVPFFSFKKKPREEKQETKKSKKRKPT